jgi:hypothetical protein
MQFSQREHDLADLAGFERSGSKANTSAHPIIIVGLAFEARLVVGAGTVLCSGDGHDLQPSLARAIRKDCCGLISFGVAGGLAPNLSPGTCIVGSEILSGTAWLLTDHNWNRKIPDYLSYEHMILKDRIIQHYDELSPYYRDLWGVHIHHGYWKTGRETKEEASGGVACLCDQMLEHFMHSSKRRSNVRFIPPRLGYRQLHLPGV